VKLYTITQWSNTHYYTVELYTGSTIMFLELSVSHAARIGGDNRGARRRALGERRGRGRALGGRGEGEGGPWGGEEREREGPGGEEREDRI
jgi:hypothetical protein